MNAMVGEIKEYTSLEQLIEAVSEMTGSSATMFQVACSLCAMRVISEDVAQVPLRVFKRDGKGGKVKDETHELYDLLAWSPNDFQTSFEFREMLTAHAVIQGGGYAYINRVKGKITELIPYELGDVVPEMKGRFNLKYHCVEDGETIIRNKEDIFHLKGPAIRSHTGIEISRVASVVLKLTNELQKGQSRVHERNRKPDGILSFKGGKLDQEKLKDVSKEWNSTFGPNGEGGVAVLEDIWEYMAISQSNADAQTIESREFQINEIARIYRVFPQMLMATVKTATYASAEQFFQAHVNYSLRPWFTRWEQALKRDLIGRNEKFECKHNLRTLMQGTLKDRNEYYRGGIESGWLMRADARKWEGLNPISGLEKPVLALNIGLIGKAFDLLRFGKPKDPKKGE